MYELPQITVEGSPKAMGHQQGEAFGDHIRSIVSHRMQENVGYFADRGITDGHHRLVDIGRHMNDLLADWDAQGHEEHAGIAAAAGVDPAELLVLLNMTDTRDLVCFSTRSDDEGCTAMLLPSSRSRDGRIIAAQTWDLNQGDLQHVVCVRRRPDDGPETVSVSVAGGPTLIGLNEHGLWVGTTNLKTHHVQMGIGYMSLLHRAIRQRTHADAASIIENATRMAAHSYWLADEHGGVELECTAGSTVRRTLADTPLVQTNHCLDPDHQDAEPPSESSLHRCAAATALLAEGTFDVDGVREVLGDRSEDALSISRHPEDDEATSTNACAIGVPATRTFHTCRGPADQGQWFEFTLG